MGWKCCAPGCRQGYHDTSKSSDISFYKFPGFSVPPNHELQSKWERAFPRFNVGRKTKGALKTRTKNSRICSLHFTKHDFISKSVDTRYGTGRQLNRELRLRRLKDDAVPSVWPKLPDLCSTPPPPRRPTQAYSTSSQGHHLENENSEGNEVEMFMEEEIQSVRELREKLSQETLPSGFTLLKSPKLFLVKLEATEDKGVEVKVSLEIEDNLTFRIFQGHHKISNSLVSHCLYTKSYYKIRSVKEVINIASYLGSKEQLSKDNTYYVIMSLLRRLRESPDLEPAQSSRLSFITEQMALLFKSPTSRRFSPDLLSVCLMWHKVSTALYEEIHRSNALVVPSPNCLRALSSTTTVETGFPASTVKYIKARIKDTDCRKRNEVTHD